MEPLSGTSATAFIDAYGKGLKWFRDRFVYPEFIRMDNQTSAELDQFLRINKAIPDLVPPNNHRSLKTERMSE